MTNIRKLSLAIVLSLFILVPSYAARKTSLPLEEIKEFAKALEIIQNNYVEETDEAELMRDAIRGMLRELDPYSVYLDKRQKETLQIRTQGKFGGLGIQVSYEKDAVKVISPIDDTPAAEAGIQSLDRIVTIDGVSTAGLDLGQAVEKMRGKPGTKVRLEIIREGEDKLLKFEIIRRVIKLKSVVLKTMKDGYVYSRISSFQESSAEDYVKLIKEKNKQEKIKGIILDLRNNPGGLLSAAIKTSDIFIDKGIIVSTAGRIPDSQYVANANGRDLTNGIPVLVLINGGSASASEIVAGALQDQGRAIVAGTKSFGKGTVQSVISLSPNASIKLTTARYTTPSGKIIDGTGIYPDVELQWQDLLREGKDKELQAHQDKVKEAGFSKDAQALLEKDAQLLEAYDVLQQLASSSVDKLIKDREKKQTKQDKQEKKQGT